EQTRQPFGGARQHLNHFLARQRAAQLQQRHLAMLLATLGYPTAARRYAARVPAASLRLLTEIHLALTTNQMLAERGRRGEAADQLSAAEDVLHRAIACGAMVDPWNVLGFQGLYPLFTATEDSVPDHRIHDLIQVVDRLLSLYAHLQSEAAAAGDAELGTQVAARLKRLAAWWDRYATTTLNDVRHAVGELERAAARDLSRKFIDYMEANADEYWTVPRLERPAAEELPPPQAQDDEEALFGAAYEGVTYQDSTDDGVEGELLGFEPQQEYDLEPDSERLEKRLRFLSTVARLSQLASRHLAGDRAHEPDAESRGITGTWLAREAK